MDVMIENYFYAYGIMKAAKTRSKNALIGTFK